MPDLQTKKATLMRKIRSVTPSRTRTARIRRIARLNVDISAERDSIRRAYTEIGKLYYETHKDAPEGYFVRLCESIDRSMDSISAMEKEITRLKTDSDSRSTTETISGRNP